MLTVKDLLTDHRPFHSELQIDWFIVGRGGFGTVWGAYKQALRELEGRTESLRRLYADEDLARLNLEEWETNRPEHVESVRRFDLARAEIRARQNAGELAALVRTRRDTEREFRRFYGLAVALRRRLGPLTEDRRAVLEAELWQDRLRCMVAIDLACEGRIGRDTLEFICAAPANWRREILASLRTWDQQPGDLFEWFERRETILIDPDAEALEVENVRELIEAAPLPAPASRPELPTGSGIPSRIRRDAISRPVAPSPELPDR